MANSTELLTAISSRDLELVRSICSDNSNRHLILKYRDRYHGNILHRAVASSSPDIVEILIKAGADPTETNYYGWSALSYAVYHNQLPMLRFMLPNASALSAPNLFGFTPLMIAIYQGNLELVKFILNATVGFDINTPLDESFSGSSVRHGNEQSGNHRNSPNNMVLGGIVGLTPLMLASHRGSVECVQLLLQRGAECNAQCKLNGWTAIMYATERSELRVIQILLDNGADIQMRNWMGKTAADVGLEIGDERVLESLVERSIDRYLPEPDFRDGSVNLTKNSREERSHNVTYATSHPMDLEA
ncbi:ankyrin repeat-containing domain protein [Cladochytrium replicatum]|nr:ankyrin repeat-containing domain protein [Cladochytrium replicatum]